jgi:hypothetical protein
MRFEILGEISDIETFAAGAAIREIARLRRIYGRRRWRKRKGIARIRLSNGSVHLAELHWESAARNSRSSTYSETQSMAKTQAKQLVVCVDNDGYSVSLEKRKI